VSTLTVWKFEDPAGAEQALETLQGLQKEHLIEVYDGATVAWEPGAKKPKTRQMHSTTAGGALGGAFWGLLFGLIFFIPILGAALGAGMGALMGSMTDVGIDDEFIDKVRSEITPGTSALFVMTGNAVQDKIHDAVKGEHAHLISSNLSEEQDRALQAAFGDA